MNNYLHLFYILYSQLLQYSITLYCNWNIWHLQFTHHIGSLSQHFLKLVWISGICYLLLILLVYYRMLIIDSVFDQHAYKHTQEIKSFYKTTVLFHTNICGICTVYKPSRSNSWEYNTSDVSIKMTSLTFCWTMRGDFSKVLRVLAPCFRLILAYCNGKNMNSSGCPSNWAPA